MPPVRAAAIKQEQSHAAGIDPGCRPERNIKPESLRQHPTQQRAESRAYIPGDKEGRIRRAAFILAAHVDEHILHRREEMPVAQAADEGRNIQRPLLMHPGKEQIPHQPRLHGFHMNPGKQIDLTA